MYVHVYIYIYIYGHLNIPPLLPCMPRFRQTQRPQGIRANLAIPEQILTFQQGILLLETSWALQNQLPTHHRSQIRKIIAIQDIFSLASKQSRQDRLRPILNIFLLRRNIHQSYWRKSAWSSSSLFHPRAQEGRLTSHTTEALPCSSRKT